MQKHTRLERTSCELVKFQQRYKSDMEVCQSRVPISDGKKVSGKRGTWPAFPGSSIYSLLFERAVDIADLAQASLSTQSFLSHSVVADAQHNPAGLLLFGFPGAAEV